MQGQWESGISGKKTDSVQEETLAVLSTEVIVDNEHNRPLLLRRRRHRLTEESLRKALAPRERVLLEENGGNRAKKHQRKVYGSAVWLLASSRMSKLQNRIGTQHFTDNLKDAELPASANTSHDSVSERPTKVATRKRSIFLTKDRNCEICKRTKRTPSIRLG